jgi:3',5'-cyclic AMP phosphodiesterase CpdA
VTAVDITTVADDLIVLHDGVTVARYDHLDPATTYTFMGQHVTTLPRPTGELLCRVATVNDVHFGETEAGRIDDHTDGPIQRVAPGDPPYPETMNHAAAIEIDAIEPAAVVVKGDLSQDGRPEEWAAFEACYRRRFAGRLHVVRGNHDAYNGQTEYAGDHWVELPGVAIAVLDTVIPQRTTGTISSAQLEWLDTMAAEADRPVLVMGHHQQWVAGSHNDHRSADYFGLHPDASDALTEVIARRTRIVAYTAGHTHRHRVRQLHCGVPSIEIGCVKDFPGTWAEYRVYEGGITQVVHRISSREALSWSEQCRHLYRDFGVDYETYALGALEDRCCNIPLR